MTTVTLATHCHARDLPRLHAPGVLEDLIACHDYHFDEIIVTHQRTGDLPFTIPNDNRIKVLDILEEDYEWILGKFGIDWQDPDLTEISHGWNWQWFFAHHCVNHCLEILESTSDYIVFNDADCRIVAQPAGQSWIREAIHLLETNPQIFIVSPSDGGNEYNQMLYNGTRLTETTSQQLFISNRQRMLEMDFTNLKWNGLFDAAYGPMQEFYGMWEGHMSRWMKHKGGLYRAILPAIFRYWHNAYH